MSYALDWTLAQTSGFQQQVTMAVYKAAVSIANEARTVHPILDQKRHTLAVQVLSTQNFSGTLLMQFVNAVVETGLTGTPTDAQVDTAVSSVWNALAGVSAQDSA